MGALRARSYAEAMTREDASLTSKVVAGAMALVVQGPGESIPVAESPQLRPKH